jgi:hypothetical protein
MSILAKRKSQEYTSALFRCIDFDGTDSSFYLNGWVMDKTHFLALCDEGITIYQYFRRGSQIEVREEFGVAAYLHLFIREEPDFAFDLRELKDMSFTDFIYRLIEVGKA